MAEQKEEVVDLTNDDDDGIDGTNSERKTQISSKQFLLTYARAPLIHPTSAILQLKHAGMSNNNKRLKEWCVGKEKHADGEIHYHFYLLFDKAIDTRNMKIFDLKTRDNDDNKVTYHPNIRTVSKGLKSKMSVIEYCMKGGEYWCSDDLDLVMFSNSRNYVRAKIDHNAWIYDRTQKMRPEPDWPILLPDRLTMIERPRDSNKKRHWIIQGAPDIGKTRWAEFNLGATATYFVPKATGYPFEKYLDEQLIVFDDFNFKEEKFGRDLLIELTNTRQQPCHVPGKSRFTANMMQPKNPKTIIILCNEIDYMFESDPGLVARFNVMEMREPWRVDGEDDEPHEEWDERNERVEDPREASPRASPLNASGSPRIRRAGAFIAQ
nr:MAG: replication associated protein [Cressdnaviricota sp.]